MQYSLFFYILFMAFCGVFANNRHIRSFPDGDSIIKNLTKSLINGDRTIVINDEYPGCPVPPIKCSDVKFWYYSRLIGLHPIPIRYTSARSNAPNKGPGPWKVLIHGFAQNKEGFPIKNLIEAYYERDDYNILVVEYDELAKEECFYPAIINIPEVAKCTAEMLGFLSSKSIIRVEDLHVIGFGLGAHVAGSIYKYLTDGKLGRVTALDPHYINAMVLSVIDLSEESANFVDVFHTNGLLRHLYPPAGHIEFFFNSGEVQPGCYKDEKELLPCSHDRSALYYIESITNEGNSEEGFLAIPCKDFWLFAARLCVGHDDDYVRAGEDVDIHKNGTYHLQTKDHHPFALGKRPEFDPYFLIKGH